MTTALYENITKKLKLEKGTYSWAKDYFSAWHRSKVGLLDDAIESYSDGVPRAVFDKHLVDEAETIAKFTTMRELLLHIKALSLGTPNYRKRHQKKSPYKVSACLVGGN